MLVVRAIQMAAIVATAGVFAFVFLVLPRASREILPAEGKELARWVWLTCVWGVLLALASWLLWLALVAASMSAKAIGQALSVDVLSAVLSGTTFGKVWLLRFGLMLILAAEIFLSQRRAHGSAPALEPIGAFLASALLITLPWASHAVGTESSMRPVHLAADAAHILGAGLWLGALVPLLFVLSVARSSGDRAWQSLAAIATQRFSLLGIVAITLLLLTGLINAWLLVGSFPALFETSYGRLVSLKVVLFVVIVAIAGVNRLKLRPRLSANEDWDERARGALKKLRRNVIAEIWLGATILAIVGGLGVTPPSAHEHHRMQDHRHS